jgi:hypothetical protein
MSSEVATGASFSPERTGCTEETESGRKQNPAHLINSHTQKKL